MTLYAILAGFIMDLLIGDPHWMYHPVRVIGKFITFLEDMLRKTFPKTKSQDRMASPTYSTKHSEKISYLSFTKSCNKLKTGNLPNVFYKATTTTDIKSKQGQHTKEKYK